MQSKAAEHPLIGIVMATYRPQPGFLRQQVESLRSQTYSRWVCVVTDDASDAQSREEMRKVFAGDERFLVCENSGRVGVFHNFERGLYLLPEEASFVCYCDQDDIWAPEKLSRLLQAFTSTDVLLAHSDLTMIDEEDHELHGSCWQWEGRNTRVHDPNLLILKNTVTGCASMFRRELLRAILPFPPQSTRPRFHHDLWTALLAASLGEIAAVPEPLVRYRQHHLNVIGAVGAVRLRDQLGKVPSVLSPAKLTNYLNRTAGDWRLRQQISGAFHARLDELRHHGAEPRRNGKDFFVGRPDLGFKALQLAARAGAKGYRTSASSRDVFVGKVVRDFQFAEQCASAVGTFSEHLAQAGKRKLRSFLLKNGIRRGEIPAEEFKNKRCLRPLSIHLAETSSHFNLFVPSVRPEHIFGGIATAVKLGMELLSQGARVRFLCTEFPVTEEAREGFAAYRRQNFPAVEGSVGVSDASESSREPLLLGKDDVFVATAWWTALLADQCLREHPFTHRKFIYLIQDFEPGFYAWSQDFALAEHSYQLTNYVPVFNTSFLKSYFEQKGLLRAEKSWAIRPEIDPMSFFPPLEVQMAARKRRRIFLYGRPGIDRNLFPTLVTGLEEWIRRSDLTAAAVEIISAGESHPTIQLPNGIAIHSVGKIDFAVYPNTLRGFDLGLSLMLSPHPSYPPLEMAACGLVTVTNRYANKDLSTISGNFVSCEPHYEGVAEALRKAWDKSQDFGARIQESHLRFPEKETLHDVARDLLAAERCSGPHLA